MKVLMLTGGVRGDVQPFIALGRALNEAGHHTIIGGPEALASIAKDHGIEYESIYDVTIDAYRDPLASKAVKASGKGNPLFLLQQFRANSLHFTRTLDDIAKIDYSDVDIVLHNHMAPGNEVAERINVPSVLVATSPVFAPTKSFFNPWLRFSSIPIPKILNKPSYLMTHILYRYNIGNTANWRKEALGLPPRHGNRNIMRLPNGKLATILQPNSLHFLPQSTLYPDWTYTTGFWYLPPAPNWTPPRELIDFIDAGEPPVYIGFGSLIRADDNPDRTTQIGVEAARLAGVRAIVYPGRLDPRLKIQNEQIFDLATPVPFSWLFPKTAAIVHHGGTGTTGVALASGRPQVVCPSVCEQPFNAERTWAIGVGTEPRPFHKITPQKLARAISKAIMDGPMTTRACEIGEIIRKENGVERAVNILESLVGTA